MSSTLPFLDYNPTNVFNKLKTHNPEATNATDRAALEAYLSARHEYDEAVKAADEAIDHHKRLVRQQDDRVLTELIRLDNLKVAHRFQPLLPRSIRAQHNKFIPRAIPNAYLPLPAPLPTSAFRRPPIPSPFLQATPRSTTIPADWQPNPGWTLKGSCRRCGSSRHWVQDCPDVRCAGCGKETPGHLERECGTRPMKRHVSTPPEEPARRVGVVVDNVFLEEIINEAKERKEKERQMKAVPIPPPRSANPEPPTSPIAGPSRPRPDTPVVFRKVDPDWTPDTTQWTWDSSWPHQKHLSGEEWMNVGRNARNEWFDEEKDDGVDWELYGDVCFYNIESTLCNHLKGDKKRHTGSVKEFELEELDDDNTLEWFDGPATVIQGQSGFLAANEALHGWEATAVAHGCSGVVDVNKAEDAYTRNSSGGSHVPKGK
ncbi:predicted protein [Postia placenta Mad-698-R]|uniref:CCHC-type domain-containing protein n=1 Tax=Postia placenta MAD-698-R-SB12 TaxID=670580 RepID=A0A1X6MRA0_9APHY|nr:hypothetical protein POSPLADRAFT_1152070 [Postia placenta MAD-698-R-SB12]EED82214.1 predicted protein [Postia placenta Mad-698-R]OSX58908.1 hypothetical protein POSPLADRAFT_1152070 [Postia placenta MAD-698-R-SB12]